MELKREDWMCPAGCHCALYHVAGLAGAAEAGRGLVRCAQRSTRRVSHCANRVAFTLVGWDVRRTTSDAPKYVSLVSRGTTWHACGVIEGLGKCM
jgi:hypothetical protein